MKFPVNSEWIKQHASETELLLAWHAQCAERAVRMFETGNPMASQYYAKRARSYLVKYMEAKAAIAINQ